MCNDYSPPFINNKKCYLPLAPVDDLVERPGVFVVVLVVLVIDDLLDLSIPLDERSFEALNEVFVLRAGREVADVFLGYVQFGVPLVLLAGLCQCGHELVQLCDELFLDVFRPRIIRVDLRVVLFVQQLQQGLQVVRLNYVVFNHLFCVIRRYHEVCARQHFHKVLEVLVVAVLVQNRRLAEREL